MALLKPSVFDGTGATERFFGNGDIFALSENIPAAVSTQPWTVPAAALAAMHVVRSNGANSVDTLPVANDIVAAVSAGLGTVGVESGTSYRMRYIQTTAFTSTLTATANTGITVTNGIVNASSVKEFLVTFTNGTPARTVLAASGTNASPVLTGFTDAEIKAVSVGMIVLNAVSGLQGTTIIGVNRTANSVTMSGNANATAVISPQFSPRVSFYGLGQGLL